MIKKELYIRFGLDSSELAASSPALFSTHFHPLHGHSAQ